jgi:hypothetical protein
LSALVLDGVLFAACGDSSNGQGDHPAGLDVDLQPVRALATVADQNARNMTSHADAMAAAAANRPDAAIWRSDADWLRAEARSMQLLSSWAAAIQYDPGARSNNRSDLLRVLADGHNLMQLGETLLVHASAMQAHVELMRSRTTGDAFTTTSPAVLGTDVAAMRQAAQAAIDRGKELQDAAHRMAQSAGIDIN